MNWRPNSDAHSPGKLGREATLFDCALDYFAIRRDAGEDLTKPCCNRNAAEQHEA